MKAPLRIAEDPADAPPQIRASVRVRTVACRLEMDESDVRDLVRDGILEGHRIGKRGVRIYVDAVEHYQRTRPAARNAPPAPPPSRPRIRTAAQAEALAYLRRAGIA